MDAELILCVDDDPFMRELYQLALEGLGGWHVRCVSTAEEAQFVVETENVNALVLDARLPGLSGLEFLTWLRQRSSVAVLVVTGAESDADHQALRDAGANEVRRKPLAPKALVEALRAIAEL